MLGTMQSHVAMPGMMYAPLSWALQGVVIKDAETKKKARKLLAQVRVVYAWLA